jgi:formylglycine-generating enzyme required for sulfatase activity
MKKVVFGVFALVLGSAFAVMPGIEIGSVSLKMQGESAIITYTLTGTPAVVTIDLQTNTLADATGDWVSIGGENIGFLRGEANKVVYVTNTPARAWWTPGKSCPGKTFASGTLRAEVTAWPTNTPPDYMVVNLCEGQNVVRWYSSTNALPGGFANLEYKSTKMVMRKVPAKDVVWMMGSPGKLTDPDNTTVNEPAHKVMFTGDYYIGIYEVTQSQYTNMGGVNESLYTNEVDAAYRPAERINYETIRGKPSTYLWPSDGHNVRSGTPIGKLRTRSGIADMDLPTEAQWEYACRAGSSGLLPDSSLEFTVDNVHKYAITKGSRETAVNTYDPVGAKIQGRPSVVGSKLPNNWGIYDMLGNVWEYCLDQMGTSTQSDRMFLESFHDSLAKGWENGAVTVDPLGAENTSNRICKRGGSHFDSYTESNCRSRGDGTHSYASGLGGKIGYIGFRLCCSVKEAVK